jgi:Uncharacterized alpha/beta hydrolase domain (DUF2235)
MEPAPNWWERIVGKPKPPFRNLQDLRPLEPWEKGQPVKVEPPANCAEQLLKEWSRRVPIHCLGVFDTVGALGLNALAIPWVRDRTAQFHDARLTTLVINGFQALAIDEHRASFAHIPWYRETLPGTPDDQTVNGGHLEQRWFVGAHSNVGGGYEDDVLSQRALAWMIEKVQGLGLEFRPIGAGEPNPAEPSSCDQFLNLLEVRESGEGLADQAPALRDSFSEFAGGIWKHFIRAKREYRRMGPPSELQNGKIVRSLNETLDPSVRAAARDNPRYTPPNLWRYRKDTEPGFPDPPPTHRYSEPGLGWWAFLLIWLALIAVTGWKVGGLLDGWRPAPVTLGGWHLSWWRLLALAASLIAFLVDWRESVLNHKTALEPEGLEAEKRLAWMDVYLGIRLGAMTAAAAGLVLLAIKIGWTWLLHHPEPLEPLLCLVVLDLLWIYFQASRSWTGGPMTDAGLESIVPLQRTRTPEAVGTLLREWADNRATKEGRQVLMPVVRSLWRDMFAFIPSYTVLLFFGSWLALLLGQVLLAKQPLPDLILKLFFSDDRLWPYVLAGALLCALADYVEDGVELYYIRRFPDLPSRGSVRLALVATGVKYLLFTLGLLLTAAATVGLALFQFWGVLSGQRGTINLVVIVAALALVYTTVKDLIPKPRPVKSRGSTTLDLQGAVG